MKWGLLFRLRSWWIGVHWSPKNRRICINLVPMVTVWITLEGGITPKQEAYTEYHDHLAWRAALDITHMNHNSPEYLHNIRDRIKKAMINQ